MLIVALGGGGSNAKAAIATIRAQGCQYHKYPAQPRTPHYAHAESRARAELELVPADERPPLLPARCRSASTPRSCPRSGSCTTSSTARSSSSTATRCPPRRCAQITAWYQQDANAVVVAPLPKLGAKVALTAWTDWTECTGFNLKAANAFRKAFRYHAPESGVFPKSALEPGQ